VLAWRSPSARAQCWPASSTCWRATRSVHAMPRWEGTLLRRAIRPGLRADPGGCGDWRRRSDSPSHRSRSRAICHARTARRASTGALYLRSGHHTPLASSRANGR
jgi:hypothetical protein